MVLTCNVQTCLFRESVYNQDVIRALVLLQEPLLCPLHILEQLHIFTFYHILHSCTVQYTMAYYITTLDLIQHLIPHIIPLSTILYYTIPC